VIFAGASARFGHPEQSIAVVTLLGGIYRIAERAGRSRAIEWALTSDDPGPFSLDRLAQAVASVVEAVGRFTVLVGHSMGAQIAELVARTRPRPIAGLVLLTPVPLGRSGPARGHRDSFT
jgi:pimeloyl-ACP methyl ester carboxylesterase